MDSMPACHMAPTIRIMSIPAADMPTTVTAIAAMETKGTVTRDTAVAIMKALMPTAAAMTIAAATTAMATVRIAPAMIPVRINA